MLRGIQSAEEMKILAWREGSACPAPKHTMRECSRKRAMMLLTRIFSGGRGRPGAGACGAEGANAPPHQLDLHAGLAGAVERVDQLAIHQRVELDPDAAGPA